MTLKYRKHFSVRKSSFMLKYLFNGLSSEPCHMSVLRTAVQNRDKSTTQGLLSFLYQVLGHSYSAVMKIAGSFSSLMPRKGYKRATDVCFCSFSFVQPMEGAPSEGRITKAALQALGRPHLKAKAWNGSRPMAALSTQIKEVTKT